MPYKKKAPAKRTKKAVGGALSAAQKRLLGQAQSGAVKKGAGAITKQIVGMTRKYGDQRKAAAAPAKRKAPSKSSKDQMARAAIARGVPKATGKKIVAIPNRGGARGLKDQAAKIVSKRKAPTQQRGGIAMSKTARAGSAARKLVLARRRAAIRKQAAAAAAAARKRRAAARKRIVATPSKRQRYRSVQAAQRRARALAARKRAMAAAKRRAPSRRARPAVGSTPRTFSRMTPAQLAAARKRQSAAGRRRAAAIAARKRRAPARSAPARRARASRALARKPMRRIRRR